MPKSTDTPKGWYPRADRIAVPQSNFTFGCSARAAVVLHIMDGTYTGTIEWFANPASQVSAHFAISKGGTVAQFVSVFDTAYANGLSWNAARNCWVDPEKNLLLPPNTPTWPLLKPPTNPVLTTIAIEHEGHPADVLTPAMRAASLDLLRWLGSVFLTFRRYEAGRTLIGHRDISPIARRNCPGPNFDLAAMAAQASGPAPTELRRAGRFGTVVRQDYKADSTPAAYLPPGSDLVLDTFNQNGYRHLASGLGFVPVGDIEG